MCFKFLPFDCNSHNQISSTDLHRHCFTRIFHFLRVCRLCTTEYDTTAHSLVLTGELRRHAEEGGTAAGGAEVAGGAVGGEQGQGGGDKGADSQAGEEHRSVQRRVPAIDRASDCHQSRPGERTG